MNSCVDASLRALALAISIHLLIDSSATASENRTIHLQCSWKVANGEPSGFYVDLTHKIVREEGKDLHTFDSLFATDTTDYVDGKMEETKDIRGYGKTNYTVNIDKDRISFGHDFRNEAGATLGDHYEIARDASGSAIHRRIASNSGNFSTEGVCR